MGIGIVNRTGEDNTEIPDSATSCSFFILRSG